MDYITSIENTPYMRWQLALLNESLKMQGLEKNLVVCSTPGKELPYERVVYHDDIGTASGYKCLNRAYGLLKAVESKQIEQPFVSIDPDTFMINPVLEPEAKVAAHKVWYMDYKMMKKLDGHDLMRDFGVEEKDWPGIGCIYCFRNVPLDTFEKIYLLTEEISKKYKEGDGLLKSPTSYWQRDMIAYNLILKDLNLEAVDYYEGHLDWRLHPSKKDVCFVHYCNGFLPQFDKHRHAGGIDSLPFKAIMSIPTRTKKIKLFKEILKSFISTNPDITDLVY